MNAATKFIFSLIGHLTPPPLREFDLLRSLRRGALRFRNSSPLGPHRVSVSLRLRSLDKSIPFASRASAPAETKMDLVAAFSLLEVMFALVILSMSLIALMQNQTQSITLAEKAKSWDVATTLATTKMSELTMLAQDKGVNNLKQEESGEFDQAKFPTYKWKYWKKPVPQPNFGALMGLTSQNSDTSDDLPTSAGGLAGPMQVIAKAWSESLTELHVEVMWGEGESLRSFDLVTHLLANDTSAKIQSIVSLLGASFGQGGRSD